MLLTNDQWDKLALLLANKKGYPGVRGRDSLLFIEAVLLHIFEQRSWRDLPPEFGKWGAVYMRFKRWSDRGCWHRLVVDPRDDFELRAAIQKIADYSDWQSARIAQQTTRKTIRDANDLLIKQANDIANWVSLQRSLVKNA